MWLSTITFFGLSVFSGAIAMSGRSEVPDVNWIMCAVFAFACGLCIGALRFAPSNDRDRE